MIEETQKQRRDLAELLGDIALDIRKDRSMHQVISNLEAAISDAEDIHTQERAISRVGHK